MEREFGNIRLHQQDALDIVFFIGLRYNFTPGQKGTYVFLQHPEASPRLDLILSFLSLLLFLFQKTTFGIYHKSFIMGEKFQIPSLSTLLQIHQKRARRNFLFFPIRILSVMPSRWIVLERALKIK